MFLSFRDAIPADGQQGQDLNPFSVTFPDAARAVRNSLEVNLNELPSRNEVFFILTDIPHGQYSNAKARRILGFEPQDSLEEYWRKSN